MSISPHFEMSGDEARGLLYGLLESNKIQLRKYPEMPSVRKLIQDKKIIYKRADPDEHWQTYKELVDQVAFNGVAYGDCEDFATAIAAEDQVRYGVQSLPYAYSPRPGLFHVVTAVPTDQFGKIPSGHWPAAQGVNPKAGYTFQDPSAAAGMGSFGALPSSEDSMQYGRRHNKARLAAKQSGSGPGTRHRRRRGPFRALGEAIAAFRKGAIGDETLAKVAYEAGTGARGATGLGSGWAEGLGSEIPGAIGIPSLGRPEEEKEEPRRARRGRGRSREEDDDDDVDDDDDDMDIDDDDDMDIDIDEDEDFGFDDAIEAGVSEEMGGLIGADAFHVLGSPSGFTRANTLFDDEFDEDDDFDDDDDDDEEEDAFGAYDGYAEGHTPMDRILASEEAYGHLRRPAHMEPPNHLNTPRASYGLERVDLFRGISRLDLFSDSSDLEDTIDEAVYGAISRMDLFE